MSRTVTSPAPDFDRYLQQQRHAVDAALDRLLPSPPAAPPLIVEVMRYSLFAGGKRLRPILTLTGAGAVTEAPAAVETAVPVACAIEMIHTYSLIHDDLPVMDDDSLRRGRPTAHVVYGDGMAVLAGDALLTEAFALLARPPSEHDPARALRVAARIAAAAGAAGMVGGQVLDLQATGHPSPPLDPDGLHAMHARKTGALIRAAAVAGVLVAGGPEAVVEAVDAYATHLGLAFQIIDDILDVEGSTEMVGKSVGKDAAAGKLTYPALYGLTKSRHLAAQAVEAATAALSPVPHPARLAEIARWVSNRSS